MGRSDGKKFYLSKDTRTQKAIGVLTACIVVLSPVFLEIWNDLRTFQKLICIGCEAVYACAALLDWPKLSTAFIIEDRQIKSRRWGKILCEVRCTGMVHYLFVQERIEDASRVTYHYLLISNRVIPYFAGQSVLKTSKRMTSTNRFFCATTRRQNRFCAAGSEVKTGSVTAARRRIWMRRCP